jgi:hypothetical protein
MSVEIVHATADHVRALSLRPMDVQTCRRAGHVDAMGGVLWSLERSDDAIAFLANDRVFCVAGVLTIANTPHLAQLWCATSPEARRYAKTLCIVGRRMIWRWLKDYDGLIAWVDAQDEGAQRWVPWLGLVFVEVEWTAPGGIFRTAVLGRA